MPRKRNCLIRCNSGLGIRNATFDVAIIECAVGISDNSQKVLHEMVRVVKPGGRILIHESTWRVRLSKEEKDEFAERYGTTPLEFEEWRAMLEKAGVNNIVYEFEQWSKPEMFWKIRKDRDVKHWFFTITIPEKLTALKRIFTRYGLNGVLTVMKNERVFYRTVCRGSWGMHCSWEKNEVRNFGCLPLEDQ